jgi:hypothetical protein
MIRLLTFLSLLVVLGCAAPHGLPSRDEKVVVPLLQNHSGTLTLPDVTKILGQHDDDFGKDLRAWLYRFDAGPGGIIVIMPSASDQIDAVRWRDSKTGQAQTIYKR